MPLQEALLAKPAPIELDEDGIWRVGGTRVRLDTVIGAYKNGCAAEEILLKYPSLKLQDIYALITYYLWNQEEVDTYLEDRHRLAEQVQRDNEAKFSPEGIRERLLARRTIQP